MSESRNMGKKTLAVLLLLILFLCGYVLTALAFANLYPGLNMKSELDEAYFFSKTQGLLKGTSPELKLTDKEGEAILKLLAREDPEILEMIRGVEVIFAKDVVQARVNLKLKGWEKGLDVRFKPVFNEGANELRFMVEGVRLGAFPVPSSPILLALKTLLGSAGGEYVKIGNGSVSFALEELPLTLKYVAVESHLLRVGLAVSPLDILDLAIQDKAATREVISQVPALKKDLASPEATNFLNSVGQKGNITQTDVEKAREIYRNLSPADKETLQKNMADLLQDPAVQAAMKKYGIKL